MTLTEPTLAPPMAPPTVDMAQIFAAHAERASRIDALRPGNKDRPEERRAFAVKCASYLHQGVSLIIIDIVTNRRANLYNEIIRLMEFGDAFAMPATADLYAAAYRPAFYTAKHSLISRIGVPTTLTRWEGKPDLSEVDALIERGLPPNFTV